MRRFSAVLAVAMALSGAAAAQTATHEDQVGDAYELRLRVSEESATTDGSSSRSQSGGALVERVVAVRADGLELEFDLPADATAEDRARDWQWPARVLWTEDGGITQLLNTSELEGRIEVWLTTAGFPREACGHWIFTWTAFRIECDPLSVIDNLKAFDLRTPLAGPGAGVVSDDGSSLTVETPIDSAEVRREKAEADVAVAEMTGADPITFEIALAARALEQISGGVVVVRETDASGRAVRQTRTTRLETVSADGVVETSTSVHTVERRPQPN